MDKKDPVSEVLAAASNIIVFADNTENKLREKLVKRGFDEALIDVAIERLKASGVVNDERLIFPATEALIFSMRFTGRPLITTAENMRKNPLPVPAFPNIRQGLPLT